MKKGFILLSVVIFLSIFAFLALQFFQQNSYEAFMQQIDTRHTATLKELQRCKTLVATKTIQSCLEQEMIANKYFTTYVYYDYAYYASCSTSNTLFANTTGFIKVDLYTTDAITNLTLHTQIYRK